MSSPSHTHTHTHTHTQSTSYLFEEWVMTAFVTFALDEGATPDLYFPSWNKSLCLHCNSTQLQQDLFSFLTVQHLLFLQKGQYFPFLLSLHISSVHTSPFCDIIERQRQQYYKVWKVQSTIHIEHYLCSSWVRQMGRCILLSSTMPLLLQMSYGPALQCIRVATVFCHE